MNYSNAPASSNSSQIVSGVKRKSSSERPPVSLSVGNASASVSAGIAGDISAPPSSTEQPNSMLIAERRQRNREHAKRSRVRKKFMLESLQEEVRQLQKENLRLRMKLQKGAPKDAQKILAECCQRSELFAEEDAMKLSADDGSDDATDETSAKPATGEAENEAESDAAAASKAKKQAKKLEGNDYSLIAALTTGQQNFVLSDPRLPDNPIVFASPGFYTLTGYKPHEVIGRNCRFLQGPGTDPAAVDVIRTAIAAGSDATVCLLNYRCDGTPFWNQFFVAALRDENMNIVNYVGVQCPVKGVNMQDELEKKVNSVLPLK